MSAKVSRPVAPKQTAKLVPQPPKPDWRVVNHERTKASHPNFVDHAFAVLHGEPTLSNDHQRGDLWDLFHSTANMAELAERLPGELHPDLRRALLEAKNKPALVRDTAEKIFDALKSIPAETLQLAESHPVTLKHFANAAMEEK
jgi:hypothetical protein